MLPTLYNDLQFSSFVDYVIESEEIDELQKYSLIKAKLENEMMSKKTIESVLFGCEMRIKKIELLKEKISQLHNWIKQEESKIDWTESGIKEYMMQKDLDEIETDTFKLKLKLNPPKLVVTDPDNIPSDYVIVETITKIKNDEIKKALKEGKEFDFAHLEQTKRLDY